MSASVLVTADPAGVVTLTGANPDIRVTARLAGTVTEAFQVLVPCGWVTRLAHKLTPEADVTIRPDGDLHIELVSGPVKVQIRTHEDPSTFKPAVEFEGQEFSISRTLMHTIRRRVAAFASPELSRPTLTAVMLDRDRQIPRFVATDSYRLAQLEVPEIPKGDGKVPLRTLIPAEAFTKHLASVAVDGEDVDVKIGGGYVRFDTASLTVQAYLVNGEFPDIDQLIADEHPLGFSVPKAELEAALSRMELLESSAPIRLTAFDDGTVRAVCKSTDIGTIDQLFGSPDGKPVQIAEVAFNGGYLAQAVAVIDGVEVRFHGTNGLKPWTFLDDAYLHLMMPVRIT
ncbi:MAG: DNA polymerase III subunit beta [Actinomycetota bacterium]